MGLPFVIFLGQLVASVALLVLVRRIDEKRTHLLHALAFVALGGILVKAALAQFPTLELLFDGIEAFVWLERDIVVPIGTLILSLPSFLIKNHPFYRQ